MRRHCTALAIAICLLAIIPTTATARPTPEHPLEIAPGSFHLAPSTTQAGAHENLVTSFDFAHEGNLEENTYDDVRTVKVNLPVGFLGSNTAVPTCSVAQLLSGNPTVGTLSSSNCPVASQVGQIHFEVANLGAERPPAPFTVPIYNMEVTSFGTAAELGFKSAVVTTTLSVNVRPSDLGLTVTSPNLAKVEPRNVTVTIWGVPAAHEHDVQRGVFCGNGSAVHPVCISQFGGPEEAGIPARPFLSLSTSCGSFEGSIEADSWEEPENWTKATTQVGPIGECERVPFEPSIEVAPTTPAVESPTGLAFTMNIPQAWENPVSISTANLKDAVVTLPERIGLNPSEGAGLGFCTEAQFQAEGEQFVPGVGCPPEAKVGTVEIETPLLTEKAEGAVYVAKPFDNPSHSLLGLYIVARVPSRGVLVKVAGEVHPDPVTGQLRTTFLDNPQVPFDKFTLKFTQGATSPLVSPPTCGTYTALADLTPWSAPLEPHHVSSSFPVETGIDGSPCPSGDVPPFHLLLHAGSYSNQAGAYSPFYIRLSREDGEQEITHFSIKLPPGLIGKLAGLPFCSDAGIAAAKARTGPRGGQEELENPSCPAASEIGHTEVEAGVGTVLASAPGKIYLAGPYHGSALSVAAITAAKVGPFDLGTVVVREALKINPETGEVFVDSTGSDPLPHIVAGIPTHLRNIRIYMDRPEFVLNPTGCNPTSTASTVLGSGKSFVSEADDQPVTTTSPFQVANCATLGFKPKLALSLLGGTKRGATPKFKAVLTARPGDANIEEAQVTLPHSEFLEQAHIGTVCTRVQFAEGNIPGEKCPAASIYGFAKAITPILSTPLEGPVYLRSSSHNLPDLVAALHNGEINIDLDGHIDSVKGRIRNTFEAVPDAPVTKFTLEMRGGKKGLLVNSTNICRQKNHAVAAFTAHSGKVEDFNPVLSARCGGRGKKKSKRPSGHLPPLAGGQ
jgi:hypothetical protein